MQSCGETDGFLQSTAIAVILINNYDDSDKKMMHENNVNHDISILSPKLKWLLLIKPTGITMSKISLKITTI